MFVLIGDNFGVKYIHKVDADHLPQALQQLYLVTTDWTGGKFSGINIKWEYIKQTARTNMEGYTNNVCLRFYHPDPQKNEHLPHKHRQIQYGSKEQYANKEVDTSPKLDAKGIKRVQCIIGALLYF